MDQIGKLLVFGGLMVAVAGALIWLFAGRLRWVGRLPGDIRTEHFYFPIVTCLVLSVVLSLVLNVVVRLFNR